MAHTQNPNAMELRATLLTAALLQLAAATAQLSGIYIVGGADAHFAHPTEAIAALHAEGAEGDVTFSIRPGQYLGQYTLGPVAGNPGRITFQSSTGEAADVTLAHHATSSESDHVLRIEGARNVSIEGLTLKALCPEQKRFVVLQSAAHGFSMHACVFEPAREAQVLAGRGTGARSRR